MTVKEIAGVRELTAQECAEINGGGWISVAVRYGKKYAKKLYNEVSSWCVFEYLSSLFS